MSVDLSALRTLTPLAAPSLEKLTTGALLKRLTGLHRLHESAEASDWSESEITAVREAGLIAFKDTALWQQAMLELKTVLATRGHDARGGKDRRRRAQQAKQTR